MASYGCYVKFTAHPGKRDELAGHMLRAASGVSALPECLLYLVNTSPVEPETVWVTEVWTSEAAHDASLGGEEVRAAIQQVLPLLAGPPEKIDLVAIGGHGIRM